MAPIERRADIVDQVGNAGKPGRLGHRRPLFVELFPKRAQIRGMAPFQRAQLAALDQPFQRIGPGRLQQPITGLALGMVDAHQRFRDQRRQRLDHLPIRQSLCVRGDLFRRRQREAAGEHSQPAQQDPFRGAEQLMAPIERRVQSLMARQRRSPAAGQDAEPFVEPGGERGEAERKDVRRGQFQRQRDAVEPSADRHHRRRVRIVEPERGIGRADAFDEQLDRRRGQRIGGAAGRLVRPFGRRQRQRRQAVDLLAGTAQCLPAGRQDADSGCGPDDRFGEGGGGLDDVFAIVEDQRQRLPFQRLRESRPGILAGQADAEQCRDRARQQRRIFEGSQFDQPDPVRISGCCLPADFQR